MALAVSERLYGADGLAVAALTTALSMAGRMVVFPAAVVAPFAPQLGLHKTVPIERLRGAVPTLAFDNVPAVAVATCAWLRDTRFGLQPPTERSDVA